MKGSCILNFNEIRILDVRIGSLSSQKVKDLQKEGIFHGTEKSFIWKNMHKNQKCKKYLNFNSTHEMSNVVSSKSLKKNPKTMFCSLLLFIEINEKHKKSSFTFCVQNFG